jgi:G:T-mismatch repair DNA endonuclease (very short patch repair protein)
MRLDIPNTNNAYWSAKISGTRAHDIKARCQLRAAGWQVLTDFFGVPA